VKRRPQADLRESVYIRVHRKTVQRLLRAHRLLEEG